MDLTSSSTNVCAERLQSLRTKFHEETHSGGTSGTSVGPKDDVVPPGVVPALKKVEEQVSGFYIDVSRVRAFKGSDYQTKVIISGTHLTVPSQNLVFLMRTA